ncbi:MAG TPA: hypothetical protein VG347_04740 [Verrucomicrobiae bacterium]|nr:hypothetical protein [Verrucomicrobiae bacterium]
MAKKSGGDKNYVSVWQWLLLFFLFALPCIGLGILLTLAFVGENESRKNYCRASLILMLLGLLIWGGIVALGFSPAIVSGIQNWLHRHHWR